MVPRLNQRLPSNHWSMHRVDVFAAVEDDEVIGGAALQPSRCGGIVTRVTFRSTPRPNRSMQHRLHVRPPYIATVGTPCFGHATRHGGFSNACQAGQNSSLVLFEQALDGRHV